MAEVPGPVVRLRPMLAADLAAVSALAAAIHPAYPESDAVLLEKRDLFPAGCRLAEVDGRPAGYLISHPWIRFSPPPLDRMLGALPASPDVFYIHDLALAPWARGIGAARRMVVEALDTARRLGFARAALVAVGDSVPFWQRHGFVAVENEALRAKLASYGAAAAYMEAELRIDGTPADPP